MIQLSFRLLCQNLYDTAVDAEFTGFTVAYTAGGMTLTGKMIEAENVNHANTAGDDVDYWSLGASFAF